MGFPQGPEWKAGAASAVLLSAKYCTFAAFPATGLQSGQDETNWRMASLKRAAVAVAAILVREGIDYAQSKAVFKAARERAGLRAAPERRGSVDRLSVEDGAALPRPGLRTGRPHRPDAADSAAPRRGR